MSERNLPAKASSPEIVRKSATPPLDLARREATHLGRRAEDVLETKPARKKADGSGLANRTGFGVTDINVQGISAGTVDVNIVQDVYVFNAPVTQYIDIEDRHVERTHLDVRPDHRPREQADSRPVCVVLAPAPAPARERAELYPLYVAPARERSRDHGDPGPFSWFALFLGFIALIFVIVAGFRAVSSPTAVIVERAAEKPRTFLDDMESRGR
ncbi:hypothetical protein [Paludisphaera mucosa]|uniref:Uncharacterized protein n=1 Tax=Paludisphaera mucosa TaxID=3030827 RepID=A0ABT6FLL5_9BACT|nr:hypothetical protein [Paludisphaera mucosa]MDG3008461.1 hypothetical protein [Paludisphaera mucosa]